MEVTLGSLLLTCDWALGGAQELNHLVADPCDDTLAREGHGKGVVHRDLKPAS